MTTETTLRAVTLQTVANYRQVADHAIGAYRASGHRLLALMARNVDRAASRGDERIAPRVADALRRGSGRVTDVAAKGIDTVSAQTERAIELGTATFTAGVDRVADRVADLVQGIENRYVATGLQAAARLSLTGAQAALLLSEKLAAGADKLSTVIAGTPTVAEEIKPAVRKAARTARKAAVNAQAEVQAEVKAVKRRVRARAAVAEVAAAPVKKARATRSRRLAPI